MKVLDRSYGGTPDCNGVGEVFLVRKPLDWSSFDVVRTMRSKLKVKKIGHAGTLDPKATGLLIVCTGPKTKMAESFSGLEKEYEGTLELGVETPSHDSETQVTSTREYTRITLEDVKNAAGKFKGKQLQAPPMYSAAKYGGKPLYYYARKGRVVPRAEKEIEIHSFDILRFDSPLAHFRVVCSKGTYIRTLVSDLGNQLGCGATLRALERTRIGPYKLVDALDLESIVPGERESEGGTGYDYRASA